MRPVRVAVLAGLAALGLMTAAAQESTPAADEGLSWLFVQAFASATLAPDPTAPGEQVLTLAGVDEAVLAFTDRPDRQVAVVSTPDLVENVAAQQDDPLNAALVAPLAGGETAEVVVELLDAGYDATAGTVTYRVVVLAEEEGPLRVDATPLAAPAEEQDFGTGFLLIDNPQCLTICV